MLQNETDKNIMFITFVNYRHKFFYNIGLQEILQRQMAKIKMIVIFISAAILKCNLKCYGK